MYKSLVSTTYRITYRWSFSASFTISTWMSWFPGSSISSCGSRLTWWSLKLFCVSSIDTFKIFRIANSALLQKVRIRLHYSCINTSTKFDETIIHSIESMIWKSFNNIIKSPLLTIIRYEYTYRFSFSSRFSRRSWWPWWSLKVKFIFLALNHFHYLFYSFILTFWL